jgi:hypothetical protein
MAEEGTAATNTDSAASSAYPALVSVTVHAEEQIHLLAFTFSDNTVSRDFQYEVREGERGRVFALSAGEHIVKVKFRQSYNLDAIQFITNKGRISPVYGSQEEHAVMCFEGDQIYGVVQSKQQFEIKDFKVESTFGTRMPCPVPEAPFTPDPDDDGDSRMLFDTPTESDRYELTGEYLVCWE